MIGLYTAAEVRAAEEPLLAATPEGTLMQRAATGLATVCLELLGRVHGDRAVCTACRANDSTSASSTATRLAALIWTFSGSGCRMPT